MRQWHHVEHAEIGDRRAMVKVTVCLGSQLEEYLGRPNGRITRRSPGHDRGANVGDATDSP
jgi:hypothetical protein